MSEHEKDRAALLLPEEIYSPDLKDGGPLPTWLTAYLDEVEDVDDESTYDSQDTIEPFRVDMVRTVDDVKRVNRTLKDVLERGPDRNGDLVHQREFLRFIIRCDDEGLILMGLDIRGQVYGQIKILNGLIKTNKGIMTAFNYQRLEMGGNPKQ